MNKFIYHKCYSLNFVIRTQNHFNDLNSFKKKIYFKSRNYLSRENEAIKYVKKRLHRTESSIVLFKAYSFSNSLCFR